jgi:hypothetical protein
MTSYGGWWLYQTLQLALFSKKRTLYATIFLGLQGGFKMHISSEHPDALGVTHRFQLITDILIFYFFL